MIGLENKRIALLFPFALVLYEIAIYLSHDMYLPALPIIARDFHASETIAQDTLLAWFLGSASMQLLTGPLSDRFGRKTIVLTGGVFFVLSTFICAFTDHAMTMIIARFIQGSTVCSVVVAGYAAIHELFDTKAAIKIIAIMGSVTILAPTIGPLFGAVIIEMAHWRAVFYFLAIWAIINLLFLFFIMPETNRIKIPLNLGSIIKDYIAITKNKSFMFYTVPYCLLFLSLICWLVESPFVIIETYQKGMIEFGLIQLIVFSGFSLGALATGVWVQKTNPLRLVAIGLIISFIASLILIISSFFISHLYWFVVLMTVISFGSAMAFAPLNRCAVESCQQPMGRIMAIFAFYMNIFGVIATWLVTLFHDHAMDDLSILIALGIVIAFLIFFGLKKGLVKSQGKVSENVIR
ncbi:MAG: Bcr/CflA family efflux MFS transporter [Candidatus Berkiellales bacterium]